MNEKYKERLMRISLELKAAKEELANCDEFINYILSFDDLPPFEMSLENIIEEAKKLKDTGWTEHDVVDW